MDRAASLPSPAHYFPIRGGRYDVSPGLYPLQHAFGNGPADSHLLQIDTQFPRYRANKIACRAERFGKYVCSKDLDLDTVEAVVHLLIQRAVQEYPHLFTLETDKLGKQIFRSHLTGDEILLDNRMCLVAPCGDYRDTLDALACQFQEDLVIVRRTPERGDWNAYLHLCSPSLWAAEEKVGKDFGHTHALVPGIAKVAAASGQLTEMILSRGPFVRFTWGIAFDDRLNQHPEPPPSLPNVVDVRKVFDPNIGPLYFRVERQTLWGLPDMGAFLFAIRVYLYEARDICATPEHSVALLSALQGMSDEARNYKGLSEVMDRVLAYLTTPNRPDEANSIA